MCRFFLVSSTDRSLKKYPLEDSFDTVLMKALFNLFHRPQGPTEPRCLMVPV